jgi:hypothetical protein
MFVGFDCSVPCGRRSNVDFVNFIWQNRDMLSVMPHALRFLPNSPFDTPFNHYSFGSSAGVSLRDATRVLKLSERVSSPTQVARHLRLAPVVSADASPYSAGHGFKHRVYHVPKHGSLYGDL